MSTEVAEAKQELVEKEPLFSAKNKKLITDPLNDNNPITIQVLGICSALAITVKIENALVMSIAVLVVMMAGSAVISMLRNVIPSRIRIIVQLVVLAALVQIVDMVLNAFMYDVAKQVGVYIGLIITNCIIMGRFEAFAMGNKPGPSIIDAFGNALGYAWILIAVAFVRELFGSGTLLGFEIFGNATEGTGLYEFGYMNNNMMILPPMALVAVGVIIWIQRSRNKSLLEEA